MLTQAILPVSALWNQKMLYLISTQTGQLWRGDVGRDLGETVGVVVSGGPGLWGWEDQLLGPLGTLDYLPLVSVYTLSFSG